MDSLRRIKRLNKERDSKSCEMSIEHDSSPHLHSSGVQCRVFLDNTPLSLSVQFIQQATLLYRKLLVCGSQSNSLWYRIPSLRLALKKCYLRNCPFDNSYKHTKHHIGISVSYSRRSAYQVHFVHPASPASYPHHRTAPACRL